MLKFKNFLIITSYALFLLVLVGLNSVIVIEWLNKSLFVDFSINLERINDSFYNGASLIFLLTLLIYAIVGTFIVSILLTNLLLAALVFANNIKVKERNEFITFSELQTLSSPKELLSLIDISVGYALLSLLALIIFLALLQFTIIKISRKINIHFNKKLRTILLFGSLSALIAVFVQPNLYNKYVLKFEQTNLHNWNPVARAQQDGFLPSFINTVKPDYMTKPKQYSKSTVKNISSKYETLAIDLNKKREKPLNDSQTILYLSETLMNPEDIPNLLLNETPMPFMSNTMKENIGGTIYSPYIGGGTANIEWSVLTSFSLEIFNDPSTTTPYSEFYVQSKNHSTALSLFDKKEKVAIHPHSAHLYKRRSVFNAVGFDDFLYLNNGIKHTEKLGTHIRVSDEALNKDVLRVAQNKDVGLIHVLSMQNHSPFTGTIPDMTYKPEINTEIFPENKEKEFFNYLQGVRASDTAVESLVDDLKETEQDMNFLLYGDHFPSVFRGLEDKFSKDQTHLTPWFLYMNNGRSEKKISIDGLSPAFLVPVLLREGNYYVTPFYSLMDALLSQDVRRIGNDYIVTKDGMLKDSELSDELAELVADYRMVVYDALFGSNWLTNGFFTLKK